MKLAGNKFSERKYNNFTTIDLSEKSSVPSTKRSNRSLLKILILVQFIIIILAGYFFYQYLQGKSKDSTNLNSINEQTTAVKQSVGKLIKLDSSVEPTIATLKDVDALKKENPDFYKDAKNGDILLIYPTRAILYSQEENIIINVAPIINNTDTQTTSTPTLTPTNTVKPTSR